MDLLGDWTRDFLVWAWYRPFYYAMVVPPYLNGPLPPVPPGPDGPP